jgi:HEAT repeat protein
LIAALGDEASMVRDSAAQALAGLGQPMLSALTAALDQPHLEAGALQALSQLPLSPPPAVLTSYARTKVALGQQYATWQAATEELSTGSEPLRLLSESLAAAARTQALRGIQAIGLLAEAPAAALVLRGLTSRDLSQQANALEMIDSWSQREVLRPILGLWEKNAAVIGGRGPSLSLTWFFWFHYTCPVSATAIFLARLKANTLQP